MAVVEGRILETAAWCLLSALSYLLFCVSASPISPITVGYRESGFFTAQWVGFMPLGYWAKV